jgi:acetolactate synthase-1/3 small subunit
MRKKFNLAIVSKNNKVFLQRVMALFYKRDYLIHNMSVDFTDQSGYAKVFLTLEGNEEIFSQVQRQVYKIVDVVNVELV